MLRSLKVATVVAAWAAVASVALAQVQVAPAPPADPDVEEVDVTPPAPATPPRAERQTPPAPSFQTRSATKAGGPANELNTGDARAREKLPDGNALAAAAGKELYHGNYCGKGDRGAGLPPTDPLDAACMRHDQCWDQAGHHSCACNVTLRREAYAVSEMSQLSREVRTRAASVMEAAQGMECQNP